MRCAVVYSDGKGYWGIGRATDYSGMPVSLTIEQERALIGLSHTYYLGQLRDPVEVTRWRRIRGDQFHVVPIDQFSTSAFDAMSEHVVELHRYAYVRGMNGAVVTDLEHWEDAVTALIAPYADDDDIASDIDFLRKRFQPFHTAHDLDGDKITVSDYWD